MVNDSHHVRIWNDDRLPDGWAADTLLGAHASKPHNPLIAAAFFRAGMIKSWGRSIQKITSICAAAGCPQLTFVTEQGGLMLTFPEPAWLRDVAPKTSGRGLSELGSERGPESHGDDPPASTRQAILNAMRTDPTITGEALAKAIGISQRAVEKAIRELRESGAIRRVGGRSAGHWEVLP